MSNRLSGFARNAARGGAAAGLGISLCACSSWFHPYRIEVQQGNFLSPTTVAKLHSGMTREQVKFLLGTPLVADPFHADRWDYVYWRDRAGAANPDPRRLALFFKDNALARVEGDVVPAAAAAQSGGADPSVARDPISAASGSDVPAEPPSTARTP